MARKIDIVKTKKKIVTEKTAVLSPKKKLFSSKVIQQRKNKETSKQTEQAKELQLYSSIEKTMLMEMRPLTELTDKLPVLMRIIEEYESRKPVEAETIELKMDSKELKGEQKAINVKVYEKILKRFDKFADKSNFRKQDLISQALLEFLEKYE